MPDISQYISIDNNYFHYVTNTEDVYFYKIYKDDILLATIHLELVDCVLYMSVVVFPEYQKQGIATAILKDIQSGKTGLHFDKIQVSIDEKNTASLSHIFMVISGIISSFEKPSAPTVKTASQVRQR